MSSWLITAGLCNPPELPVGCSITKHISGCSSADIEASEIESLFSEEDSKEQKILKLFDAHPELDHVQISELLDISRTWARSVLVRHKRIVQRHFKHKGGRGIVQLSMSGEYVATYKTQAEAANITGFDYNSIGRSARGVIKSTQNFIFLFLNHYESIKGSDDFDSEIRYRQPKRKEQIHHAGSKKPKKVVQIALDGKFIRAYASINQAAKAAGCSAVAIHEVCYGPGRTRKGYRWMFLEDYELVKDQDLSVVVEYKKIFSIYQYDRCGKLIEKYRSLHSAMIATGISRYMIKKSCADGSAVGGFVFKMCEAVSDE